MTAIIYCNINLFLIFYYNNICESSISVIEDKAFDTNETKSNTQIVSVYIWECTHCCTNDAIEQYNNITQLYILPGFFKLQNNTLLQFNIREEANHSYLKLIYSVILQVTNCYNASPKRDEREAADPACNN